MDIFFHPLTKQNKLMLLRYDLLKGTERIVGDVLLGQKGLLSITSRRNLAKGTFVLEAEISFLYLNRDKVYADKRLRPYIVFKGMTYATIRAEKKTLQRIADTTILILCRLAKAE